MLPKGIKIRRGKQFIFSSKYGKDNFWRTVLKNIEHFKQKSVVKMNTNSFL
jgi:hypothetical protein